MYVHFTRCPLVFRGASTLHCALDFGWAEICAPHALWMTVSISCEALVWPGGLRGPLGEKRREKRAKTRRKLGRQARATSTFGNASAGGLGIDDPFNGSQLYTVLDFTDALIDDFVFRHWTMRTITKLLSPSSYWIVLAHTDANPSTRYLTITHLRKPVPVPTSELPDKWIILDPYLPVLEALLSYTSYSLLLASLIGR